MKHITLLLSLFCIVHQSAGSVPCTLATNGTAQQSIITPPNATATVTTAANSLATMLGRITGGTFTVQTGSGVTGIAVGRAADFPALVTGIAFDTVNQKRREEYLLRSHTQGVWLVGATDGAVKHAVWDLLYRLGYRQFFPGPTWEVVPAAPTLNADVDHFEKPDFYTRRIWYGYGTWGENIPDYTDWAAKNRAVQGIALTYTHVYQGIISRNTAAFTAHPEYLALVNGVRTGTKLANANPGLRQLCVDDALARLAANPTLDSLSMEPSDGGGWDESPESATLGSISDQALSLANHVATGIETTYPGKLIGMAAYNQHSPPPNITAHPNVIVNIATAFINGGYTADQLLDGWAAKTQTLGIYDYFSVNLWDRDLPGAARGGNPTYLRAKIPQYHQKGARFWDAEASENFGPNGLGYFLSTRMLWDVDAAADVETLTADFLQKCFGTALVPMTEFYTLLDGNQRKPLSDDLIGRMFRRLDEAWLLTSSPAVRARLDALTLYTRYVELYLAYTSTTGTARQTAFENLIKHSYRMRGTHLVHSLALYIDLVKRDAAVSIPVGATYNVPEPTNPWKSSVAFTRAELDTMRVNGIANHALFDFTPVSFSDDLVPAAPLALTSGTLGSYGIYSHGTRHYHTWINAAPATLNLSVKTGLLYTNRGPARLKLFPAAEPLLQSVASAEVPPDLTTYPVAMSTTYTGLHRVELDDVIAGTLVTWPAGSPMTIISSAEKPTTLPVAWTLYFYVPRGTPTIGGFSEKAGQLQYPNGTVARTFPTTPEYFSVPVPPGQDGKLWRIQNAVLTKHLMTVPPCMARSAAELLLPREVVARDVALATGITNIIRNGTLVTLTCKGIAGTSGTLQSSVNLVTWTGVKTVNFTGTEQTVTHQESPAGPTRFFRLAVP